MSYYLYSKLKHMKTIDVKKVISTAGLDYSEVAAQLYPGSGHPRLALNRVAKGDGQLDAVQISKLALLAGVSISEVFGESPWSGIAQGSKLTLLNGDYKAELDKETWAVKVFDKGSLFHDEVLVKKHIPLSEFIEMLNSLILNK